MKTATKSKPATGMGLVKTSGQALAINKLLSPAYFEERKEALVLAAQIESVNGRCLNDQILIRRSDAASSYGSIFIPETAREKSEQGVVVAVGPGMMTDDGKRIPLGINVGEGVKFSKYYGTPVTIGGVEFLQLRECEIEFAAGVPRSDDEKAAK
jgi:chaperonin GroES